MDPAAPMDVAVSRNLRRFMRANLGRRELCSQELSGGGETQYPSEAKIQVCPYFFGLKILQFGIFVAPKKLRADLDFSPERSGGLRAATLQIIPPGIQSELWMP